MLSWLHPIWFWEPLFNPQNPIVFRIWLLTLHRSTYYIHRFTWLIWSFLNKSPSNNNGYKIWWPPKETVRESMKDWRREQKGWLGLEDSPFHYVQAHLTWICCLQFEWNAIQFSLESVLGTSIHHLHPHLWWIRWPNPCHKNICTHRFLVSKEKERSKYASWALCRTFKNY